MPAPGCQPRKSTLKGITTPPSIAPAHHDARNGQKASNGATHLFRIRSQLVEGTRHSLPWLQHSTQPAYNGEAAVISPIDSGYARRPIPSLDQIDEKSAIPYTLTATPGFAPGVFVRVDRTGRLRLHVDAPTIALW